MATGNINRAAKQLASNEHFALVMEFLADELMQELISIDPYDTVTLSKVAARLSTISDIPDRVASLANGELNAKS